MAAKNIGKLLHSLAQFETWDELKGDSIPVLRKAAEWQREVFGTADVQELVIICRAGGRKFSHDWLAEQQAKLIEDCGFTRAETDRMTAAEFATHARKLRSGSQTDGKKPPGAPRKGSTAMVLDAWDNGYRTGPQILEQVPTVGGKSRKHKLNAIQQILIRNDRKGASKSVTQSKRQKSRQIISQPAEAKTTRRK
jgi:hypothetical protein